MTLQRLPLIASSLRLHPMLLKGMSPLPIGESEEHCLKLQKCVHSFPESELLILRFQTTEEDERS